MGSHLVDLALLSSNFPHFTVKTVGVSRPSHQIKKLVCIWLLSFPVSTGCGRSQSTPHVRSSSTQTVQKQWKEIRLKMPAAVRLAVEVLVKRRMSVAKSQKGVSEKDSFSFTLVHPYFCLQSHEKPFLIPQFYAQELEKHIKAPWRTSPGELGNKSLKPPKPRFRIRAYLKWPTSENPCLYILQCTAEEAVLLKITS